MIKFDKWDLDDLGDTIIAIASIIFILGICAMGVYLVGNAGYISLIKNEIVTGIGLLAVALSFIVFGIAVCIKLISKII